MIISIITVSYNSSETIADCISSVNNQTYKNIEHIIIDGASKDGTIEKIKTTPNRIAKIISEPDKGIYDAMNKGILLSTGDIIGMLNADDQLYDITSIEKIVNTFQSNKVDCCYGNLIFQNKEGKIVRRWHSKPFKSDLFLKSWTPAHPTFYCKRNLYYKYGLYKTDYRIAADVELMLRFLEINKIQSFFIDKYLVKMKSGGTSNQGLKSTFIITKEMYRAFKENGLHFNLIKYLFYKGLKIKEFFY
jgi:glycosyltransferase involved in cell wall biosynthesis